VGKTDKSKSTIDIYLIYTSLASTGEVTLLYFTFSRMVFLIFLLPNLFMMIFRKIEKIPITIIIYVFKLQVNEK
jgi:hypothetical protein